MDIDVGAVRERAAAAGLTLDPESVAEHDEQGVINRVYTADTDRGEVVIHVGQRLGEDTHAESKRRIYGVGELLEGEPVPTAAVYCYGTTGDGRAFVVQERLPGRPLSGVTDPATYFEAVGGILARLHGIETEGYGLFHYRDGDLFGPHDGWEAYLRTRCEESLAEIEAVLEPARFADLQRRLDDYFAAYGERFRAVEPRFCHGDVGFGNVLVDREGVTGIVDFEWANSGDPAMDFIHDEAKESLPAYADSRGGSFDRDAFAFRTQLYGIVADLGIAEIFSDDPEAVRGRVGDAERTLEAVL